MNDKGSIEYSVILVNSEGSSFYVDMKQGAFRFTDQRRFMTKQKAEAAMQTLHSIMPDYRIYVEAVEIPDLYEPSETTITIIYDTDLPTDDEGGAV